MFISEVVEKPNTPIVRRTLKYKQDASTDVERDTNHSVGCKTHCLTSSSKLTGFDELLPKDILPPTDVCVEVRVCNHVKIASVNSEEYPSGEDSVSGAIGDSCEYVKMSSIDDRRWSAKPLTGGSMNSSSGSQRWIAPLIRGDFL